MERNGLIIKPEKWTGKPCPECGSEMFADDKYYYCSRMSCSGGGEKEKANEN